MITTSNNYADTDFQSSAGSTAVSGQRRRRHSDNLAQRSRICTRSCWCHTAAICRPVCRPVDHLSRRNRCPCRPPYWHTPCSPSEGCSILSYRTGKKPLLRQPVARRRRLPCLHHANISTRLKNDNKWRPANGVIKTVLIRKMAYIVGFSIV